LLFLGELGIQHGLRGGDGFEVRVRLAGYVGVIAEADGGHGFPVVGGGAEGVG